MRVSRLAARTCVILTILALGNLQAANAQSMLHLLSDPGEVPASATQVAGPPAAWSPTAFSAPHGVAANEIRIVGLPNAEPTRSVTASALIDRTSSNEAVNSTLTGELELAAGLTAASLNDISATPRRLETPVGVPQTDLVEKLRSYVLATQPLTEGQPPAVTLAESGRTTVSSDAVMTVTPAADGPQDLGELLAVAPLADGQQAIGQPNTSHGLVSAAPAVRQPLAAKADVAARGRQDIAGQPPASSQPGGVWTTSIPEETIAELPRLASTAAPVRLPQQPNEGSRVAAPAHLAPTTDSAAETGTMILLAPSQPSPPCSAGTTPKITGQFATQEAQPALNVPGTLETSTSRALHDESLVAATGAPPVLSLAANEYPGADQMNLTSVGAPAACPYLPCQSGAQFVCGVDCGSNGAPCCRTWKDSRCIPWSLFGPGEYVGPARNEHVSTYYLRVNDLVTLTFITSRRKEAERYRIGCGDQLTIVWVRDSSDPEWKNDRKVRVQPDGTIALPLIGEVTLAGKTVQEATNELVSLYSKYQREPQVSVIPLEVNTATEDIIRAVTSISGSNGQTQALRITPEGTIQAPGIGSVYVQGLTLDELASELKARYTAAYGPGLLVSPSLTERATSYVFVGGEVRAPSRYTLEGPTTVMQAITLAGGWNNGGNLHQVVVFRRDENWCLKAIKIDVHAPLYGRDPCPANDIWLRDNDLVIVPKSPVLCATDAIELYFTRGVYAVFPISFVYDFTKGSSITPVP